MLVKYQAMLIAATVLFVHYTIYVKTEDTKKSLNWSLITLVAMVALTLIALPVLHGSQDFLLDITKGNIHATYYSQLPAITRTCCANRLSYLLQLY